MSQNATAFAERMSVIKAKKPELFARIEAVSAKISALPEAPGSGAVDLKDKKVMAESLKTEDFPEGLTFRQIEVKFGLKSMSGMTAHRSVKSWQKEAQRLRLEEKRLRKNRVERERMADETKRAEKNRVERERKARIAIEKKGVAFKKRRTASLATA